MALKTFVKINSVNNLSDARYCAGMHVDIIGFNVGTNDDSVSPEQFKEITSWVSGVSFAAELESPTKNVTENYTIEYVESDDLNFLKEINKDLKTIYRTSVESLKTDVPHDVDFILVNEEGALIDNQIDTIRSKSNDFKIIIGFGVDANNVDEILEKTKAYGIALTAGDEIRPGYKDYDELADILEALEIDEWA